MGISCTNAATACPGGHGNIGGANHDKASQNTIRRGTECPAAMINGCLLYT
jgi:hypothetical protein